jgi:RIO kinase 1
MLDMMTEYDDIQSDTTLAYEDETEVSERETYRLKRKSKRFKHSVAEAPSESAEPASANDGKFKPSFTGSKHERQWIMDYLGLFYDDHVITDVLRQVKGGKEATVYCCRANPAIDADLIAAKVYRPRMFRQLRNDAVYRKGREMIGEEGKVVRKRREKLAMEKKTGFGQILRHTTWLANEFETLRRLYQAGADVPKPFASSDNAILMEYMGEETVPAPALSSVRLEPHAALVLWKRLMENVELMLANDRVHGDLSAYNVLYWNGKAKIIDLPQAVDPYVNPEAYELLERDVERLCSYFERYGVISKPRQITRDLWDRYIFLKEN